MAKATDSSELRTILMSRVMMQATLEDRKTKTRRVIVPQPLGIEPSRFRPDLNMVVVPVKEGISFRIQDKVFIREKCPYGQPGQILVARATWAVEKKYDHLKPTQLLYAKVRRRIWIEGTPSFKGDKPAWAGKSRPGRFAPRTLWDCFPKLRLEAVAVERVQHISDADIAAEGVQYPVRKSETPGKVMPLMRVSGDYPPGNYLPNFAHKNITHEALMRAHFAALWDTINAARGYTWQSNPYVWCLTFSRITA